MAGLWRFLLNIGGYLVNAIVIQCYMRRWPAVAKAFLVICTV